MTTIRTLNIQNRLARRLRALWPAATTRQDRFETTRWDSRSGVARGRGFVTSTGRRGTHYLFCMRDEARYSL